MYILNNKFTYRSFRNTKKGFKRKSFDFCKSVFQLLNIRNTINVYPGIASSIPAQSDTFVEINHEIISRSLSSLPLSHSRRTVVRYKRKYVHEVLVNRLFKLAHEKVWLCELTVPP